MVLGADICSQAAHPPVLGQGCPHHLNTNGCELRGSSDTSTMKPEHLGILLLLFYYYYLASSVGREANSGTGDAPEPLGHSLTAICKGSNWISPQPQ